MAPRQRGPRDPRQNNDSFRAAVGAWSGYPEAAVQLADVHELLQHGLLEFFGEMVSPGKGIVQALEGGNKSGWSGRHRPPIMGNIWRMQSLGVERVMHPNGQQRGTVIGVLLDDLRSFRNLTFMKHGRLAQTLRR